MLISILLKRIIFYLHAHGDHILDVEAIAERTKAVIVSNAEIASYYATKGFQAHPMNHGGSWNFDFGKVKYVNAIHSVHFLMALTEEIQAVLLSRRTQNIYIAGDTALLWT
jgi:L-ascorbate metabolism protein UlaG (beta-lactamase superfamily)